MNSVGSLTNPRLTVAAQDEWNKMMLMRHKAFLEKNPAMKTFLKSMREISDFESSSSEDEEEEISNVSSTSNSDFEQKVHKPMKGGKKFAALRTASLHPFNPNRELFPCLVPSCKKKFKSHKIRRRHMYSVHGPNQQSNLVSSSKDEVTVKAESITISDSSNDD